MESLPEECIAHALSFTTTRDAARAAAVSRIFRSAADSDMVWSKFLPKDTDDIILSASSSSSVSSQRKKDVYFQMCNNPVVMADGSLSFSLDKESGKKCYMISAKNLSIIWGDWIRIASHQSRFSEVMELRGAYRLEIQAKIELRLLSSNTNYAAYFIFKFADGNCGFDNQPVEASVFAGFGDERRTIFLDPDGKLRQQHKFDLERRLSPGARFFKGTTRQLPQEREDGWMEVEMGEFMTDDSDADEVIMNLREAKSGKGKYGLIMQGIELRPKQRKTDAAEAILFPVRSGRPRFHGGIIRIKRLNKSLQRLTG